METITRDQFDNLQIGNKLKSECYSLTVESKFLNTIIAVDDNDGIAGVYSFDNLVRGEYSIISNLKLLEKAIRDYPIGTKIKSIYDGYIYICNTKPFFYSSIKHIYVKDENRSPRCIYDKTENKWAEIINQNIMTEQEFKDLKVGDFISIHEIIHKYKEFLIVKCDDGHDLFDLAKINKLGLKSTPETFLGVKIGSYDSVPVEINGNTLAYLLRVRDGDINIKMTKDEYRFNHIPQSIRIL